MKVTMYGSHLCQYALYAIFKLRDNDANLEFKNISSSLAVLKEFIQLREGNTDFDEARQKGSLGIPYFILENGTRTHDLNKVLELI